MSEIYESSKVLAEYLLFHYGADDEILPPDRPWPEGMRQALGFPVRTVGHFSGDTVERGLDLGCAVGRSTVEMARNCRNVTGIDFSHAFVGAATALIRQGPLVYDRCEEAARVTRLEACIPADIDISAVDFQQGDAMNLPLSMGPFDRVHAANLLCRLSDPRRLLVRLPSLVKPAGELVLATPCTWLEEYTPRSNWPVESTFSWLLEILDADFTLVRSVEEPFLIRETARKFQWTTSLVTVWQRKD